MSTSLPIADGRAVRRYAAGIARRNPRLLWTALSLHVLAAVAALAAPRLLGELVEAVETGTTTSYVDQVILVLAGFLVAADGPDPLRPLRQPGARREGARRAARGLRRQRPGTAGRRGRVGRLRRPADPHEPRRRPARLVGALGAAGVDDRGGHGRADVRGRDQRRLVGARSPACSASRRW